MSMGVERNMLLLVEGEIALSASAFLKRGLGVSQDH